MRFLSQRPVDLRIDRNDAVAVRLHVHRYPVTGAQRAIGKSHDRDGAGALEQVRDGIRLRQGSHAGIVVRRRQGKPVPTWSVVNQRLVLLSIFCLNIFVASLRTVSEISLLLERLRRSPISMFFISPSERSKGVRGLKTRLRKTA
jgi:hypothetical protein